MKLDFHKCYISSSFKHDQFSSVAQLCLTLFDPMDYRHQAHSSFYCYSDEEAEGQRGKQTLQGQTAGVNVHAVLQSQVCLILALGSQPGGQ